MKYKSVRTSVDGIVFQSKKEATRWVELQILERAGKIKELRRQTRFELIPKCGKERAAHYTADFTYYENGELVVEDVKSGPTKTKDYILRRKLLNWRYGIKIREV